MQNNEENRGLMGRTQPRFKGLVTGYLSGKAN